MGMPAIRRHWTTNEVRDLIDESRPWPRYELIGGELIVSPAPGTLHQLIIGELFRLLADYVEREGIGVTLMSPADLELAPGNITQPDIFVVPGNVLPDEARTPSWTDVSELLLAVETLSPSSIRYDRIVKRDYYLDAGVPDYWVVDWDARFVERWSPERPTPHVDREALVWHPSGASEPLVVSLPEFFTRVGRMWRRN